MKAQLITPYAMSKLLSKGSCMKSNILSEGKLARRPWVESLLISLPSQSRDLCHAIFPPG